MDALALALSFGLGAGLSPGPLMALVISATLERGFGAGFRVASAPLLTDVPVILASLWFLSRMPAALLAGMNLVGGALVVFLGVDTLRRASAAELRSIGETAPASSDLWRAAVVNILSPHPWLAWIAVLGPAVVRLWHEQPHHAVGFVVVFYGVLVGSKVVIAALMAWSRDRLSLTGYRRTLMACGVMLLAVGLLLLAQGGRQLLPSL